MRTLQSIEASSYRDFDVIIVDQSSTGETAQAIATIVNLDSRYRYIKSTSSGLSAGRNIGIAHAHGPVLAFTDDDCVVSKDWLQRIVGHFEADSRLGQVCGEVRPGAHDPALGFVPAYVVSEPRRSSTAWTKWRCSGIGANMALRADVFQMVGPLDEVLGVGSPLFAAEDYDLTFRVLKAGYSVLSVPDAYVVHHGFRDWKDARNLMRRSGFGIGAAYMKHIRLGDLAIVPTFVHDCVRVISVRRLLRFQRSSGLAYVLWYLRGAALSFRYPIDKRRRVYLAADSAMSQESRDESERAISRV